MLTHVVQSQPRTLPPQPPYQSSGTAEEGGEHGHLFWLGQRSALGDPLLGLRQVARRAERHYQRTDAA